MVDVGIYLLTLVNQLLTVLAHGTRRDMRAVRSLARLAQPNSHLSVPPSAYIECLKVKLQPPFQMLESL